MPEPTRSPLRVGFALVAFTLLTLAVFRPTPGELSGTLPAAGGSSADALLLTWAMDHVSRTLFADPRALFDAGIFHPLRDALALGDHMIGQALLGLPIRLAGGGPLLAYNLLSLASYAAGGTAMFAYARSVVGGGVVPGLVAGIVFAFTPYRFASPLWLQVLWTAFVPLALLAWLRFVATRSAAAWTAWVACWIAQALMGQYVALYFTLVMGALGAFALVAAPARRDPRLWLGTLLAPLVVGLALWPTVAPYLALRAAQGTVRTGGLDTPLAFLWPAPGTLLGWALPRHAAVALGPGIVAWTLALAGLLLGRHGPVPRLALPRRFVWAVHVVGVGASLALVLAPLRWQHLLPGLDMARNSNRAFFVGLVFVAALAASATRWLNARRLRGRLAGFVILALALADMGRPPREHQAFPTAATLSPGVRRLAALPAGSIVYERADLPDTVALAMYHAIFHRHPMPIGYSGFLPPGGDYVTQRLATFPSPGAARLLRQLGVGWVLLRTPHGTAGNDVIARATALGARLDTRAGPELVFDVRDVVVPPPTPSAAVVTPAPAQLTSSSGDAGLERLVDGDPATLWNGPPVAGVAPSLTVDLGALAAVSGVELIVPLERAAAAFRGEVAVSDDGRRWQPLAAVFEPADLDGFLIAPPAQVVFVARWPAVPARFLRLTNPFVSFWQEQLGLLAANATRMGLAVDLGWHGDWMLSELRVLEENRDDRPPGEPQIRGRRDEAAHLCGPVERRDHGDPHSALTPRFAGPRPRPLCSPGMDGGGPGNDDCVLCGGRDAERLFVKNGWPHVRCRSCGLVSLRPLPTEAELAAHHERSYADGAYADFAAAEPVRDAVAADRLARLRPLAPAGPWLDVGASAGAFVAAAVAAGLDAEGIEVSASAVALAQRRHLPVRQTAVEAFAPARAYAVVTAFDVVEHLPRPAPLLARVREWLAPGGLLALTVPNVASLPARLLGRHWYYYAAPDHVHHFTPATVARLLDTAGFTDVAVRPVRKPLPLDYATAQAERLAAPLAPLVRLGAAALPRRWRDRPLPLPLGEMLVTARPR